MKKIVSLFMVILVTAACFAGCGNKDVSNNVDANKKVQSENVKNENAEKKVDAASEEKNVSENEDFKVPDFIIEETENTVKYKNPMGEEVEISKKPKKVVVLQNSILDLWYLAGGEAIGRVSGTTNVPKEAESIEIVGGTFSPNVEKLLALQPDLVVLSGTSKAHKELKNVLSENNIPALYVDLNYNPYKSFLDVVYLFTRVTDKKEIFDTKIAEIQNEVNEIIKKVENEEKPKAAILFSSSRSVKLELPASLTGEMVKMLKVNNVIEDAKIEGATKVDFSMERLIEKDPDIILITIMGNEKKAEERLDKELKANEAWSSLRAVKEDNVYYLPKDMFTYKPNARYGEAVEYLAKILYPNI